MSKISQWLSSAASVLMPRACAVCGKPLAAGEKWLCRRCLDEIPATQLHTIEFNDMEKLFATYRIERATGYFYYEKTNPYAKILHDIKYRNMPTMGQWLAARAATQIVPSGFFNGIDAIVPVPLHKSKLAKRGYNQTEYIARGLSQVTGIPVVNVLYADRPHSTQTHKDRAERLLNTQGLYVCDNSMKPQIEGKHLLIVDDVVTTGATLLSCALPLLDVPNVKISFFTLAVARLN